MNIHDYAAQWSADRAVHALNGVTLPDVVAYLPPEFKHDYDMACDALPTLTTSANSAVPAFLTTLVDPAVFKILFAPNRAAIIFGEVRKGSWLDETALFPTIENTGEVSSYGDFNENGRTGVNTNWPQRQSYLFQTIKEYGDRELERAGLARINWVSEIDASAALILNKYSNLTYFFGVQGLQNYGLLNDPALPASITPSTKAAGGTRWQTAGGAINATANEIFNDIQAIFLQLVNQTQGLVEADTKLVLAMSPAVEVALTATNTFNVNVYDLLKKNFPNIRFETAVQYGTTTSANPQGQIAGNLVQFLAEELEGQETGYCAFNEKMHAQTVVRGLSSYKQKVVGGTWGAIIRQPFAIASMLGV
jgi:Uncharacterized protein conserved in bacteria (DUF2184)